MNYKITGYNLRDDDTGANGGLGKKLWISFYSGDTLTETKIEDIDDIKFNIPDIKLVTNREGKFTKITLPPMHQYIYNNKEYITKQFNKLRIKQITKLLRNNKRKK